MSKLVAILLAGIAVFLPFVGEQVDSGDFCNIAIMVMVGIIAVGISLCRRNLNMDVSRTDVALLLFTGYVFVCDVFSSGLHLNRLFLYIFLSLLYISVKLNRKQVEKYLPYGIILTGVIQSCVAYMQLADVIPSFHSAFPCTGSFFNPAPLGAVIAIAIVIGTTLLAENQGFKRYLMISGIAFMLPILFYADSRASWLACGVSVVLLLLNLLPIKRIWKVSILIACLGLSSIPLYNHKPTSADARLLIWNNCATMIKEKPIIGHGTDAVKRNYMLRQAEYFAQGGSNEEKLIAAHNNHAFNEALNVLCSYGLVGLTLMVGVAVCFFLDTQKSNILSYSMGCIMIFSMFSYPMEELTFNAIAIISIACVPSKVCSICLSLRDKLAVVSVVAVLSAFFGYRLFFHEKINKALDEFHWDRNKVAFLADNFNTYEKEPLLVARYGLILKESGNYDKAVKVLKRMCELRPTPDVFYDLGECYEKCKLYEEAEKCYHLVADMLPAYITPQYRLLRLYQRTENVVSAKETACYMLAMPLKKETAESEKMKLEAKDFLHTLKAYRQ